MTKARDLAELIGNSLIDGDEIATGAVGTSNLASTLDFSSKTMVMANDQLSGDKIHGGTISNFESTGIDDNSSSTSVTILSDGKVGIGTDSPGESLVVAGDGARITVESEDMEVAMLGRRGSSGAALDDGYLRLRKAGVTADGIVLNTGGSSWLNGGNVGIGTDSPASRLNIKLSNRGISDFRITDSDTTSDVLRSGSQADGDGFLQLRTIAGAGNVLFDASGVSYVAGGNFGVGTDSPVGTLDVRSTNSVGSVFRKDFNGSVADTFSKVAVTLWGQDHDDADIGTGTDQFGPMLGFGARIDDGNPNSSDVRAGISYSYNGDLTFHAKAGASVADGSYERIRIDGLTGNVGIGTTSPNAFLSVYKDNGNSGNQFVVADTEGATPAVRTYTHNNDDAGLILNHYYAISGSGNQYMRYADFVANVGNGAGTTMRFITKNSSNTFSTGLQINQDGKVIINSGYDTGNFGMYIQGKGSGVGDARALHLRGFGGHTTIGTTGPTLVLQNADGTANNVTKLSFETSSNGEAVSINCINTNHSSFYGDMAFNTRGAVSGYSEKLRIKADGNVGIGWNDPYTKLHVNGPIQDIEHAITNNSAAQWSKIGTIYGLYQGGANIHVHFKMHSGYNANNAQDYNVDLFMKTSNGSSTNSSGGSLINSWWYKLGNSGATPRFKWKKIATNDYELFMYVPAFAGNSSYTVKKSAGQWANSGAVLQSDPGSDSSTVLEATNQLGFYTQAVFNDGLKVSNSNLSTLQGSFYNNGVREYSQYIDDLVNNSSVNFDVPVTRTGKGYTVYYECMYNHFGNQTYGSWKSGFFSFRSDSNNTFFDDPIHNGSSAGGGAWTVTLINPNTATPYIRFNKSAGTYVGNGDGHIFVRGGAL